MQSGANPPRERSTPGGGGDTSGGGFASGWFFLANHDRREVCTVAFAPRPARVVIMTAMLLSRRTIAFENDSSSLRQLRLDRRSRFTAAGARDVHVVSGSGHSQQKGLRYSSKAERKPANNKQRQQRSVDRRPESAISPRGALTLPPRSHRLLHTAQRHSFILCLHFSPSHHYSVSLVFSPASAMAARRTSSRAFSATSSSRRSSRPSPLKSLVASGELFHLWLFGLVMEWEQGMVDGAGVERCRTSDPARSQASRVLAQGG